MLTLPCLLNVMQLNRLVSGATVIDYCMSRGKAVGLDKKVVSMATMLDLDLVAVSCPKVVFLCWPNIPIWPKSGPSRAQAPHKYNFARWVCGRHQLYPAWILSEVNIHHDY